MNSLSPYEELDQAISRLQAGLAESQAISESETIDLLGVAQDLTSMPRVDFMSRLLVELEWQAAGREITSTSRPRSRNPQCSIDNFEFMPTLLGRGNGLYPFRGRNIAASVALHAGLFLLLGSGLVMVSSKAHLDAPRTVSEIELYTPSDIYAPHGGGSGATDQAGASHGPAPRFASEQFTPPKITATESRLQIEDTLIGPPDLNVPNTEPKGDPLSTLLTLSSGVGVRGIGSGEGDGDGSGHGSGRGPGSGGGSGIGSFLAGRGVTPPRLIYKPEPEYSDEARQMKHQGIVTLSVVVGVDGRTKHIEVVHSLGMGLDEKAVEAVRIWRFEPGMKDGHPIPTQVTVDVDFHLF
jgi:periplasmic protein TonB